MLSKIVLQERIKSHQMLQDGRVAKMSQVSVLKPVLDRQLSPVRLKK